MYHAYDLLRARSDDRLIHRNHGLEKARNAAFIFSIWLLYLSGAAAGTSLGLRWKLQALYVPISLLLIAIAIDQAKPLSVEEEQDRRKGETHAAFA